MGDAVYDTIEWFVRFMDGLGLSTGLWLAAGALMAPLGTLVHELGHALEARRHGVVLRELMSEPEGPALAFRSGRTRVRIGLGLGRDLKSRAPLGWVLFGEAPSVGPHAAIGILRAGPLAQARYGAALLLTAALPLPALARVLLALNGVGTIVQAVRNLRDRDDPESDGAQIARIRAGITPSCPRAAPPAGKPAP